MNIKLTLNHILDLLVNQSSHPSYLFEGTIETGAKRSEESEKNLIIEAAFRTFVCLIRKLEK